MKNLSLQDQLLNAGLVSTAKAKAVKTEKHKQTVKQRKNHLEVVDDAKLLVQQAKAEQAERDRVLNAERAKLAEQKQIAEQIRQLIETNRLAQDKDGVAYHFNDQNKVKTLWLSSDMRDKIAEGKLAIVKWDAGYAVIPAAAAEKIKQRDAASIVVWFDAVVAEDEEAYRGYEVPDDLMW